MRLYRVATFTDDGMSAGMLWFTNRREAERAAREAREDMTGVPEVEPVDITPTKRGILRALRIWASHPDNG